MRVTGGTFTTIRISLPGNHPAARHLGIPASLTTETFGRAEGRQVLLGFSTSETDRAGRRRWSSSSPKAR